MTRIGFTSAQVLSVIDSLGEEKAYPVRIWDKVDELRGEIMSPGYLYGTLDELEAKRLITSRMLDITGKERRHYSITDGGEESLQEHREAELNRTAGKNFAPA